MLSLLFTVLLVCLQTFCQCSVSAEVPPTAVCQPFVTEGDDFTCECKSPTGDPSCRLSWPGHTEGPVLNKRRVKRQDTGTTFTCQMDCDGDVTTTTHTLQVAYGPSESGVTVSGPVPFLADGKKSITLTCTAVDVNPKPVVSWQGVVCDNGNDRNTCIFTPNHAYDGSNVVCRIINSQSIVTASAVYSLNLTYPPPVPPKLSGYTRGEPLRLGDSPKCTVTGGKPLVSSVNFSCSEDVCPDQPDIVQDNSVISPLVNASERNTTKKLRCRCTAHWDVEPALYALTAEDTLEVETSGEQNPHGSDQDGTNGESSAAVAGGAASGVVAVIVVAAIVVIIVKRNNVKLYKASTYNDVEDNFPMPPPIGDCRDTNKGEKSEIQMDCGYSTPLDQISGSSSDGSMKKPCPAKWRVVGSADYCLVEESDAGIGQSPLRVLTKDKHGYSDVEVLGPSPPIDSASATPFEVVNVTPTGASPLGAVPDRKDGFNRQFSSDVHQVRGPHGDFYAQVHKVPKGVSGLPTTGGNATKVEGKNPQGASETPPTADKQEKTQAEGDDDGTYDRLQHHGSHPAPHAPEQLYSHINE